MKKYALILSLTAFIALSCSSPSDAPPQIYVSEPVVTGIRITNVRGDRFGYWGVPSSDENGIPLGEKASGYSVSLGPASPNPMSDRTMIRFAIPSAQHIKIFIAKAKLAGVESRENNSLSGAIIPKTGPAIVRSFPEVTLVPGYHVYQWDTNDDHGNPVPSGFYRVYLASADTFGHTTIRWQDVYVYRSEDELPEDMMLKNRWH